MNPLFFAWLFLGGKVERVSLVDFAPSYRIAAIAGQLDPFVSCGPCMTSVGKRRG